MKFSAEICYAMAKNQIYHPALFQKIGDTLIDKINEANVLDCCELFHGFCFAFTKNKSNKLFLDVISKRIFLIRKRLTKRNKQNLATAYQSSKYDNQAIDFILH
jgi:hypothetical protein